MTTIDAFAKIHKMAKQKFRPTRLGVFSGAKAYIWYVEVLKKRRNAVGRTFCDAITTTASNGALIIATIPLCTEIVAALRRRRMPSMVLFGSCLALVGVAVLVGPGAGSAGKEHEIARGPKFALITGLSSIICYL
jgi:drug/metabolite transporter (DMT)-like permease